MKHAPTSNNVYVMQSKIAGAGRGVFAANNIKKSETIETCPFIDIPEHSITSLDESILITYIFFYGARKEKLLLALGLGSIYNHSHLPNAKYKIRLSEQIIEFTALRDIKKDEEITFNYKQGNSKNKIPLWFE